MAGLIFVSQQLAPRRNLHIRQTTYDNMSVSGWTGLGADLLTLWSQSLIVASVIGTLRGSYFVFAAIIHVTTPAIFSLQPFSMTSHTAISTTLGPPNISVKNLYVSHSRVLQ